MFDEQRLGNDGTEASRPCKPDDGDNHMKEKDEDIAHSGMVSKPEKTTNFAQFSNSPWTGSDGALSLFRRCQPRRARSILRFRASARRTPTPPLGTLSVTRAGRA